jgi:hypothetical protein
MRGPAGVVQLRSWSASAASVGTAGASSAKHCDVHSAPSGTACGEDGRWVGSTSALGRVLRPVTLGRRPNTWGASAGGLDLAGTRSSTDAGRHAELVSMGATQPAEGGGVAPRARHERWTAVPLCVAARASLRLSPQAARTAARRERGRAVESIARSAPPGLAAPLPRGRPEGVGVFTPRGSRSVVGWQGQRTHCPSVVVPSGFARGLRTATLPDLVRLRWCPAAPGAP